METAFGPDTAMSEVVEARYTSGSTNAAYSSVEPHGHMKTPTPSAGKSARMIQYRDIGHSDFPNRIL